MSVFDEIISKTKDIFISTSANFDALLKEGLEGIDKILQKHQNGRRKVRGKLQIIDEDVQETSKPTEAPAESLSSSTPDPAKTSRSSSESNPEQPSKGSKKRNKNEVEGILSPEQEKRVKRNASVKAQSSIAKQVNVNLTQKLRREDSAQSTRNDKTEKTLTTHSNIHQEENKENFEPIPINQSIQASGFTTADPETKQDEKSSKERELKSAPLILVKQEKISIPESMEVESLPVLAQVKQQVIKDDMPPPLAPVPRARKGVAKASSTADESTDEETAVRRSVRVKKLNDSLPLPQTDPSSRSTRATSRTTKQTETSEDTTLPEARPKRTRGRKKADEVEINKSSQDSGIASPAERPRPKRTRRAAKPTESKPEEPQLPQEEESTKTTTETPACKTERTSEVLFQSPILLMNDKLKMKKKPIPIAAEAEVDGFGKRAEVNYPVVKLTKLKNMEIGNSAPSAKEIELSKEELALNETRVVSKDTVNVPVEHEMDRTMVLTNGMFNHAPVTPTAINTINDKTIVLSHCNRETIVLDKPQRVMNETIVINKDPVTSLTSPVNGENVTDDNSLLTDDDSDARTPPKQTPPTHQTTSAVKEKVQQFEELAARVTRTKTRAMAKKEEDTQTETPPDKVVKQVLPMETLQKMNSMIFSGKPPTVSSSAYKPRIPVSIGNKSQIPSSTSKLNTISKAKEAADETALKEKEDARKKKEAMLEAKREQQRKKREEKMAAAAAAREAAFREKQLAMESAAREKMDRQAHADQGKIERQKEVERKKQELARKVAENEERRKAEEQARQQRLAEELKRAEAARKKQLEEAEATQKEAAMMAKEIHKRQKEYYEKQKLLKQRSEEKLYSPVKSAGPMDPVYMQDGFQYLDSDESVDDKFTMPLPAWSTKKAIRAQLALQAGVARARVDRLFGRRVHSPDLRAIFPAIERTRLKRTSSAVWRTPPALHPLAE